eukprot:scaffold95313_cov81-Phaeocystis_antarctica.AAC.4
MSACSTEPNMLSSAGGGIDAAPSAEHEVAVVDAHSLEELEQLLGHLHPVLPPRYQPRRVGVQPVGADRHQYSGIPRRGSVDGRCELGGAEPPWPVGEAALDGGGVTLVVARVQAAVLSERQRLGGGLGRCIERGCHTMWRCGGRAAGVLPAGPGRSAIHKRHPAGPAPAPAPAVAAVPRRSAPGDPNFAKRPLIA